MLVARREGPSTSTCVSTCLPRQIGYKLIGPSRQNRCCPSTNVSKGEMTTTTTTIGWENDQILMLLFGDDEHLGSDGCHHTNTTRTIRLCIGPADLLQGAIEFPSSLCLMKGLHSKIRRSSS